jgi:uncharacterized protein (TIGR00730 family)
VKRVAVFCGSSDRAAPVHADAATSFGALLARRGLGLVYGGSSVGLMGRCADAALAGGGEALGVLPRGLFAKEIAHRGLTELFVVETMHERKAKMAALADAFVALPGGLGTLEELFEVWTRAVLGIHQKPVGVLDVDGFYAPLLAFLDRAQRDGFLSAGHRSLLFVDDDPERLLDRMAAGPPVIAPRYLGPGET